MATTRARKESDLKELKDLISKSSIIVVWDYLGLSANEISDIRTMIRNGEAVNKVYKNRIAKLAFKESGKKEVIDTLTGPSSFLFVEEDDMKVLSGLNKFIKDNENISFKAGYINGDFYDAEALKEVAGLPSKDDLLSMLLSTLEAPMRNLAYTLSQVASEKKE